MIENYLGHRKYLKHETFFDKSIIAYFGVTVQTPNISSSSEGLHL